MNTFFSGSVKGFNTLPFWYPGNTAVFLNGTEVNPRNTSSSVIDFSLVYGMQGFVDAVEYQKMVNEKWFGIPTPKVFKGFNQYGNWPFWSSDSITKVQAIEVTAKIESI